MREETQKVWNHSNMWIITHREFSRITRLCNSWC